MAITVTAWKRGDGIITAVESPGGDEPRSGDVKYRYAVAWVLGGGGHASTTQFVKPTREYSDDDLLAATAEVGDPCTVTVCNGVLKLFVQTEVWAETDCEDE